MSSIVKYTPTRLIGTVGISIGPPHAAALSMKIAPDRFSMGVGVKLAPQFVHFLLAHEQIKRVWAYTDVDNKGVSNLLRQHGRALRRCHAQVRNTPQHFGRTARLFVMEHGEMSQHVYVTALMHCALLMAAADRDAKAVTTNRLHPAFTADEYRESAAELVAEANRVSIECFGRFASNLI